MRGAKDHLFFGSIAAASSPMSAVQTNQMTEDDCETEGLTRQQRRAIERAEAKKSRITPAEFGRRKMKVIRQSARAR